MQETLQTKSASPNTATYYIIVNMSNVGLYFDYAAATPLDERVLQAMLPYFTEKFYNPSSPYAKAIEVRREYAQAKDRLAHTFGAGGDEIVMTAGATESINLAMNSFSGHKICSVVEHHSVINALKQKDHTIIGVSSKGRIQLDELRDAITDRTELISVALANHELGVLQPVSEIANIVKKVRQNRLKSGNTTPIYLHCDASQGFGMVDIHTGRLGVDLLTLNAGKIYGPKQVGLLWIRPGVVIRPTIVGGGQESGLRSGTENVAGTIGFAKAAEISNRTRKSEVVRITELRNKLQASIVRAFPQVVLSGDHNHRLGNFLHLAFPKIDAERLVFMLESKGVSVATGSACAANKDTRSSVLVAIKLDEEVADGSLRITLGRFTEERMIDELSDILIDVVGREYSRSGVSQ